LTQLYTVYTLVDITDTNVTKSNTVNVYKYNQKQNLNTLIQIIGLRSQPLNYSVTTLPAQDIVNYSFGKSFSGLHTVWKLEFASEHKDVFSKSQDNVYFLKEDSDGIPITTSLDETVNLSTSAFESKSEEQLNIYFLKSV
jgi:hypothetical protein